REVSVLERKRYRDLASDFTRVRCPLNPFGVECQSKHALYRCRRSGMNFFILSTSEAASDASIDPNSINLLVCFSSDHPNSGTASRIKRARRYVDFCAK